jgi:hypothetical protein
MEELKKQASAGFKRWVGVVGVWSLPGAQRMEELKKQASAGF